MSFNYKKSILIYYTPFLLIAIILFTYAFLFFGATKTEAAWYTSGGTWLYRKQITIDHTKVGVGTTTPLTNFPMLFSVTDSDLKFTGSGGKVASSTGYDILFTSADGTTKLNHEIENYASTTGQTFAWVQIPSLSTIADTIIYIYYGNVSATDQRNVAGTWDSNYKGVWHLSNGTTLSVGDSTSLNSSINNSATAGTGKIDGAATFADTSYVAASSSPILSGQANWTISAWIKDSATFQGFGRAIYTERAASGNDILKLDSTDNTSTQNAFITYRNSSGTLTQIRGTRVINDNLWHQVVAVLNSGTFTLFVDGTVDVTGARNGNDTLTDASKDSRIGNDPVSAQFIGIIDEMRISNSVRSSDQITTEYNNQNSPSTFYAYSATQTQTRQTSTGGATSGVKVRGGQTPSITTSQVKLRGASGSSVKLR